MRLKVRWIKEISVIDKNMADIVVADWEEFETSEKYGKSYLVNYPQYFEQVFIPWSDSDKEVIANDKVADDELKEPNNKELAEMIIAKGGKPAGNKEQLKAILAELEANENVAPEKTDAPVDNSDETNPVDENDVK